MIMSNIILFSIIVGRGLAKGIGGPLIENDLLKDDSHRQFSDTREEEEMDQKAIGEELISAYSCLENSMPSTKISLNPPPGVQE